MTDMLDQIRTLPEQRHRQDGFGPLCNGRFYAARQISLLEALQRLQSANRVRVFVHLLLELIRGHK